MQPQQHIHDVIVVGAGPAGATTAYYLTRGGGTGETPRVALLDEAHFPRDKVCGDAWCATRPVEDDGLWRLRCSVAR